MWCANEIVARNIRYLSIGNRDLTENRANRRVGCSERGNLNDYVPFYFCTQSVMLYLIHKKHSSTYGGGQEPILHFESTVSEFMQRRLPFFFTDRHAYTQYARQFDDIRHLSEVDWATVNAQYWNKTPDDPDRQERKMAECLVHRFVPIDCVTRIGVYNERYKDEASELLAEFGIRTPVRVRTGWYY